VISEGSCDTEDWSNDAENIKIFNQIYFTNAKLLYVSIMRHQGIP